MAEVVKSESESDKDRISIYCIQCGKQFKEYWGRLNCGDYGTCSRECEIKISERKHKVWKSED